MYPWTRYLPNIYIYVYTCVQINRIVCTVPRLTNRRDNVAICARKFVMTKERKKGNKNKTSWRVLTRSTVFLSGGDHQSWWWKKWCRAAKFMSPFAQTEKSRFVVAVRWRFQWGKGGLGFVFLFQILRFWSKPIFFYYNSFLYSLPLENHCLHCLAHRSLFL